MKAFVFAAGKGTRLKPLTDTTPKPLIEVGGTTPLLRTLRLLQQAGIQEVVVNVSHLRHQVIEVLKELPAGLKVHISDEGDTPLETAGGILKALPLLGEAPFLAVNGDVWWDEEHAPLLAPMMAAFDPQRMAALLAVVSREKALAFTGPGDFERAASGQLEMRLVTGAPTAAWVYACVQILQPRFFVGQAVAARSLREDYLRWAAAGQLYGHVYTGDWVDIGSPEQLEAARARFGEQRLRTSHAE